MTTSPLSRRIRRAVPALAVAATVTLSGCQVMSPIQTDKPYDAADGVPVDLGDVQVRNLVIVSEEEGGPGTITGSVTNTSGDVTRITFAVQDGGNTEATVDGHSEVSLSVGAGRVTVDSVPVAPGGLADVQVSTDGAGANLVEVPVLPATNYYEGLAPESGE